MLKKTKRELQAQRTRIRKRLAKVSPDGAAARAYRKALEALKLQFASLRRRLVVESPDAE